MRRNFNYDKYPCVKVSPSAASIYTGWAAIGDALKERTSGESMVICLECYPGTNEQEITGGLAGLGLQSVLYTKDLFKEPPEIEDMLKDVLGDDPVFGRMNTIEIGNFLNAKKLSEARDKVDTWAQGVHLVIGTGSALVARHPDVLVLADLPRWEIQGRQRRNEIGNLGAENLEESPSLKYKRAFFVDWRAADRLKKELLPKIDFLLITNDSTPRMVEGNSFREALRTIAHRPFRVVPYFDPGPWGGHWMEEVCDLPADEPNHAWCFDCVPEENSLLIGFGDVRIEVPASDLTFMFPRELLGEQVHARFGAEFPIRFDFLDTMGGGNLSLQVHPQTAYIREHFGMDYTQDESYYLLDAGNDGSVYLGLREGIDRDLMVRELWAAQQGGPAFAAEKYVNHFPARKHDHFLIPAGTIHCSGKNSMVLEISATPYIFTFKLWDWGRLGLNGLPRPIHIQHGIANIEWGRDTTWVKKNLINRIEQVGSSEGLTEERTGLHYLEFIETRRHWFTGSAPHDTRGTVNVLNLVAGREVTVESPSGAFEPFVVHYAETFIVPASVGLYTIKPSGEAQGTRCGTIKAYVRSNG